MRPDNPHSVYLDSCVWIDLILGASPEGAKVLADAQNRRIELFISPLTMVEVLGKKRKHPMNPQVETKIVQILEHPAMIMVELGRELAMSAREMAHQYSLKPPDAIHLASAVMAGVDVFMTGDTKDFPIGSFVQNVWVDEPYQLGGPTLF